MSALPEREPLEPLPGPEPVPEQPDAPPQGPKRKGGGLAVLLFLGGLGLGAWLFNQQDALDSAAFGQGGGPSLVRTVTVDRSDLPATIRLGGTITAQTFAAIRAPRLRRGSRGGAGGPGADGGGGLTLITMAEPGSNVQAGEVVAEFDRQEQQELIDRQEAAVVQAAAMIDSQRARLMIDMEMKRQELVNAKAEYEKAVLDRRKGEVLSEIQAEILDNQVKETEATYRQLESEVALLEEAQKAALKTFEIDKAQEEIDLKRAEMNAEHMVVKTPISGTVVMQTTFRGGTFAQTSAGDDVNPGTYFMQIVDPASMVLEAQVNQADSQRIRVGMPATIRLDAYPDESWEGRVLSVAAMTGGTQSGRSRSGTGDYVRNITVTVEILERDKRIIPDLSASADIVLQNHPEQLVVPREAVRKNGEQWIAQVREGEKGFESRPVEIGPRNDTHVAVVEGLEPGDEVALDPVAVQ